MINDECLNNMKMDWNQDIKYSEEQERIFFSALHLFSSKGYESVTIGTIAKDAKVKTSAISYLGGKKGLLGMCYKYFLDHCYVTRLNPRQYKPILLHGTEDDVINVLLYTFPDSILKNMFECLVIIVARLYIDEEAKNIYTNDINRSMEYMNKFFKEGIKIGRFRPFDIHTVSLLCVGFRLFGLQLGIIEHETVEKRHYVEIDVFNEIKKLIPFEY